MSRVSERQVGISRFLNTNSILPFLVHQGSNTDVEDKFFELQIQKVCHKLKAINWRFDEKIKQVGLTDIIWITKHVETESTFWFVWSFSIVVHGQKLMILNRIFQQNSKILAWDFEEETQVSSFGEEQLRKLRWVQIRKIVFGIPRFQCRKGVDSCLTQRYSKSRCHLNQACSCSCWEKSLNAEVRQNWEHSSLLGISGF